MVKYCILIYINVTNFSSILFLVFTNKLYTITDIYISIKTRELKHQMVKETLTFSIEKELKIELKVLAVRQEKSLTKLLNEILQDYVNENK